MKLNNQKGYTLTEVLVVCLIMVVMTVIIAQLSIATVRAMVHGTRQTYAQSSAELAVNKIANDLRSAGSQKDSRHILDGSGKSAILIRMFALNQDSFDPSSDDLNDDIACYKFRPPSGTNQYDPDYKPGYIQGGAISGDPSELSCMNYYPITDKYTDIRDLTIEYCRPAAGEKTDINTVGSFNCSSSSIDNGNLSAYLNYTPDTDISDTAMCVWMVRISVVYSKMHLSSSQTIDPDFYNNAVSSYQTAVMLRNPYFMSLFKDYDNDGIVDCCDITYNTDLTGDANWCPDPQSS